MEKGGGAEPTPLTFLGVNKGKDNLQQLQQQLQHFSARKRASKQQLQSLAGSLNWACQAIRGGRFFLRRILNTLQPLQQQRHKARLSAAFKQELQWWLSFYTHLTAQCTITQVNVRAHVYACTDLAAGTFGQGKWTYTVFAEMRHACSKPSPHQLQRNMCSGSRSGRLFILTAR